MLDAVLLFGVCLQWWVVGLWLEHPAPFVRVLRIVVVTMTVLGLVMTLLSVPTSVGEIAAIYITIGALSLLLILAWVFLAVIGTLSVVLKSARTLRATSQLL